MLTYSAKFLFVLNESIKTNDSPKNLEITEKLKWLASRNKLPTVKYGHESHTIIKCTQVKKTKKKELRKC